MDNMLLTAGNVTQEIDDLLSAMVILKENQCDGGTGEETCTLCDLGCHPKKP